MHVPLKKEFIPIIFIVLLLVATLLTAYIARTQQNLSSQATKDQSVQLYQREEINDSNPQLDSEQATGQVYIQVNEIAW